MPAVLSTSRLSPAYIDSLLTEILVQIGRFVVRRSLEGDDPRHAFALVAVSRRWRKVFLEDPIIWGDVQISQGEGEKKMNRLLEKGAPRRVFLGPNVGEEVVKMFFDRIRRNGASLTSLRTPLFRSRGLEAVWRLFASSLLLTHLDLSNQDGNLRRIPTPSSRNPLSNLTDLILRNFNPSQDDSIYDLLQQTPNLLSLTLVRCSVSFASTSATPRDPSIISLPKLQEIYTENSTFFDMDSTIFHLPRLEDLAHNVSTDAPFETFLFPPSPHPPNVSNLREIFIAGQDPIEDESLFIDQLKQMRSLVHLGIGSFEISDETIDALASGMEEEDAQEVVCPLLRRLEIEGSFEVTGEALVRLVLAREQGWERGRCGKLENLDLVDSALDAFEDEEVDLLKSKLKINEYPRLD